VSHDMQLDLSQLISCCKVTPSFDSSRGTGVPFSGSNPPSQVLPVRVHCLLQGYVKFDTCNNHVLHLFYLYIVFTIFYIFFYIVSKLTTFPVQRTGLKKILFSDIVDSFAWLTLSCA
jgi:hypothetical protein